MTATNDTHEHDDTLAEVTEEAAEGLDRLPSSGLLSFYDRLRERIAATVEQRAGSMGKTTSDALLLVPDVFMLLLRLALDKNVPKAQRALVSSALAYFVLPADFLPELIIGPTGYVDDLVLAVIVLANAFSGELEPYAEKYWSGSKKLRVVLRDVLDTAGSLVNHKLYDRLRGWLAARGIDVDDLPGEMRSDVADG